MRSFAYFHIIYYRGGEIWVKEKVHPLKIINTLFLKPHTHCHMMYKLLHLFRKNCPNPYDEKSNATNNF